MKFVHIADMHFDTSFTQLSNSENLGNLRRLEQKKVFKKVIEYIKITISSISLLQVIYMNTII